MSGQLDEALAAADEALALSGRDGESFHTPELFRIRGRILSLRSPSDPPEVERWLVRGLNLARRQSALAWELRAATNLAGLWRDAARRDEAREVLAGVYGQFTEGFETPDLAAARRLLIELKRPPASK